MTNTSLLEEKIKSAGLKKKFIASALNITPYGLSLKINNKNEFKASEIDILSELLNIVSFEEQREIFFAK